MIHAMISCTDHIMASNMIQNHDGAVCLWSYEVSIHSSMNIIHDLNSYEHHS
jgi:hypothetical protein